MHTISADTGVQRGEGIGFGLEKAGVEIWESYSYAIPLWYVSPQDRDMYTVLKKVKERGFRTIVVAMGIYFLELPYLADAAEALGMNNGEYVWIFQPDFEMESIYNLIHASEELMESRGLPSFANVTKLLEGAALIQPVEPYQFLGDSDPFWQSWKSRDTTFIDRLNDFAINGSVQNLDEEETPREQAREDFFKSHPPQLGTTYLYDAILSIGIGACIAQNNKMAGTEVTGASHVKGIHSSSFTGASGTVRFDQKFFRNTRDPRTATFGVFNLYPPKNTTTSSSSFSTTRSFDDAFVLTGIREVSKQPQRQGKGGGPGNKKSKAKWVRIGPEFVYANGKTTPPELLRDAPEQNYLSKGLRVCGLTLMAINITAALASLVWVLLHWQCRVIRASQPYFLVLLLFGAIVSSLAILARSFDESSGMSTEALSHLCMAGPWLFAVGYHIMYGALFTKLWRINKVLQFRRQKINSNTVAGPMFTLIVLTIILMTIWTIQAPLEWQRVEIDEITGESIGRCNSDSGGIYMALMLLLAFIPTLLTCLMAWKTRDVDDIYSESSWIFALVVVQIQVLAVGIPIGLVLSDISTDGEYLGMTLILFTIPMSMILLIIVPKIVRHYRDLRGGDTAKTVRGAHAGVVVSGMSQMANSSKTAAPRTSSLMDPHHVNIRDSIQTETNAQRSNACSKADGIAKFNDSYQIDFSQESDSSDDSDKEQAKVDPPFHDEKGGDEDPSFHE